MTRSLLLKAIVGVASLGGLLFAGGWPAEARASKPRLHLERLEAAPGGKDDELRLYASALELEGGVVEGLGAAQFTLLVDGKAAGRAAQARPFSAANEEVDVAFVVETSAQYKKDLGAVTDALKEFLEEPPRKMRAMLIPFSSDFEIAQKLVPAAALGQNLDDLSADEDSVDLRMVDAVGAAITELRKLEPKEGPPPRRMIVLVSDGLNVKMDRATFRGLGDRAAKAGIPVHTIAFSPTDDRGPLLNLGELSKRSNGTFRWAQKKTDLKAQIASLGDEINKQYVLTFKATVPEKGNHSVGLRCDDMVSNVIGGKGQFGTLVNGAPGQKSSMGWLSWVLGGAGLLLLGLIVVLVLRARDAALPKVKKMKPPAKQKPAAGAQQKIAVPVRAVGGGHSGAVQTAAAGGAAQRASTSTLIGIGGAWSGNRMPLNASMSIGKAPGNSMTVSDDPTVSGRHAEVGADAGGPWVKDLGSTNGTFVNNQRIAGTQRLRDGDIVRFGAATQFKVRVD